VLFEVPRLNPPAAGALVPGVAPKPVPMLFDVCLVDAPKEGACPVDPNVNVPLGGGGVDEPKLNDPDGAGAGFPNAGAGTDFPNGFDAF